MNGMHFVHYLFFPIIIHSVWYGLLLGRDSFLLEKAEMEKRELLIPYDEELFSSLNAIEYSRSRIGNFLFEKRSHTHDDLAYALALACLAAKEDFRRVIIKV